MLCVGIATIVLYLVCVGWKGKPAIVHRWEGAVLLAMFVAYTLWVVSTASAA